MIIRKTLIVTVALFMIFGVASCSSQSIKTLCTQNSSSVHVTKIEPSNISYKDFDVPKTLDCSK